MAKLNLKKQLELLKLSEMKQIPLSDVLFKNGYNYDDLVYRNTEKFTKNGDKGVQLSDISRMSNGPPFVSFFSGAGGMDLGLEAIGWQHIAAFELNDLFCKTLRKNRPHWRVFGPPIHTGDVSDFSTINATLSSLISKPFEGIFVGGPPCQPFSIASNQRYTKSGKNFKRTGFLHAKNGNLLFDFVDLIIEFQPRSFIIENVPGLRDIDNGKQLNLAIEHLEKYGYFINNPFIINASDYGIAQERNRLFIIGSRSNNFLLTPQPHPIKTECGETLKIKSKINNHETRLHKAQSISRYMELNYGARDQLGRVDRLHPKLPAKTVIAGGTNGGGRSHLHPEIPRTLSVRECARLQSFPDDYVFVGPTARQFTQVGNAVPPVLSAQIGIAVEKLTYRNKIANFA